MIFILPETSVRRVEREIQKKMAGERENSGAEGVWLSGRMCIYSAHAHLVKACILSKHACALCIE